MNAPAMAAHPSESEEESRTATLGMWVFLATEVLFFGVLFFGYTITRLHYPDAFAAASRHTDVVLGSINTGVLLTSSLAMALAVRSVSVGALRLGAAFLVVTLALGLVFLGLKSLEYVHDYEQHLVPWLDFAFIPAQLTGARLFFYLYFVMTGAHAVHLIIGLALVAFMLTRVWRERITASSVTPLEVTALYWHLIDIIWIFLYPLLYLVSRT
jgi:cytochrome c oxidase subunit III